ncbi:hypothetical protein HUK80_17305 [Flavobacterium sp. MAH-1]|uniref:Uncharacterized protein n=1 Tax=Flavobacterium agri TaxID=2743471 RepID=A0A7Y8Y4Y1_9FLAO|nr:hypothetical protein [Flavobacterium agri]NUY82666.1 hypothetical protein [Flavobacterium agri]NYA72689.1 hypothetical protein [Flavobacterium agri]
MRQEILRRFLTNTDETGRFLMKSRKTGIVYFVEPIYNGKTPVWGDLNPATKQLEGNYGSKYTGAVTKKESIITEENGFENIGFFKGSPFGEIDRRDREHEARLKGG